MQTGAVCRAATRSIVSLPITQSFAEYDGLIASVTLKTSLWRHLGVDVKHGRRVRRTAVHRDLNACLCVLAIVVGVLFDGGRPSALRRGY